MTDFNLIDSLKRLDGIAAGAMEVPFPDVWIPFSDDLRMLAGCNNGVRKIKINGAEATVEDGATVSFSRASTATYIDKSGVLRTAAIDEPRFEHEGLLIEGQSTNLFPLSSTFTTTNIGFTRTNVASLSGAVDAYEFRGNGLSTANINTVFVCTVDKPTISFFVKIPTDSTRTTLTFLVRNSTDGENLNISTFYKDGTIVLSWGSGTWGSTHIGDGWFRIVHVYNSTVRPSLNGKTVNLYLGSSGGGTYYTTDVHLIHGIQVEALPFATSYIPTNGAAVTRASDWCKIKTENNARANTETVAVVVAKKDPKDIANSRIFEAFDYGLSAAVPNNRYGLIITSGGYASAFNGSGLHSATSLSLLGTSNNIVACRKSDSVIQAFANGIKSDGLVDMSSVTIYPELCFGQFIGVDGVNGRYALNGHIRNFRIWHHALTDEQIKGLK